MAHVESARVLPPANEYLKKATANAITLVVSGFTHCQECESRADRSRDFGGLHRRDEFGNEQQPKIDGCTRAPGGEQSAVLDDALIGQDGRQLIRDRKMCGISAAVEQARIVQHRGRGADRREPAAVLVMAQHEGAHAHVGTQVLHSWPAWKKKTVVRAVCNAREGRVSVHCQAVAAGHMDAIAESGNRHFDSCPSQQVDRGRSLNFLKSLREDCENGGHRVSLRRMAANAHGNLSGKHLVILGCGYVGSEVARQALQLGLNVTALTRNPASADRLRTAGVTAIAADLGTDEWHGRVQGGADFVLNCVSSGGGGVDGYRRSYVDGMRSILTWAQRRPAGTLIYTGSTSVYPQGGGATVDETAPTAAAGETAQVLLEAEGLLRNHPGACARWFILRLAGIYGPGRQRLLDQVRAGEVAGRAQDHLNLIHRDDICRAIWAALQAPAVRKDEVFNVADDGAATRGEIVGWLSARLGVPHPRFTEGPAAGRRATTPDRIIANARLKHMLGWRPAFPSFREGYAALLNG